MDAEDFELAVTAIIMLRKVRKRMFKREPMKKTMGSGADLGYVESVGLTNVFFA